MAAPAVEAGLCHRLVRRAVAVLGKPLINAFLFLERGGGRHFAGKRLAVVLVLAWDCLNIEIDKPA